MGAEAGVAPVDRRWMALLVASFVPFAVKATAYATLGRFLPMALLLAFAALVAWGVREAGRRRRRVVAAWAVAVLIWAVARLVLYALEAVLGIPDAHVADQLTAGYLALSVLHLAFGVILLRWRGGRVLSSHPGVVHAA